MLRLIRLTIGWTLSVINGSAILFLVYVMTRNGSNSSALAGVAILCALLLLTQYICYRIISPPSLASLKALFARLAPRTSLAHSFRPHVANILPVILYLLATALLLWDANTGHADDKSVFVELQIPIALQLGVLGMLHLLPRDIGWIGAYAIIVPPTIAAIYAAFSLFRYFLSMIPKPAILVALLALLSLVAFALFRPSNSATALPAMPRAIASTPSDSSADIPDSLFRYSTFASTSDSAMFGSTSIPACNFDVRTNCIPELGKAFFPPVVGAIGNLLHMDAAWITKAFRLTPLSKVKLPNGQQRMVFQIGGDDFSGVILINKNLGAKANYAVLLSGGGNGGPAYEDDSLSIWPVEIEARIAADSLIKTYRHSARFNDTARAMLTDSGRVVLLMKPDKVDTVATSGLIKTSAFLKTRFHLESDLVEEW